MTHAMRSVPVYHYDSAARVYRHLGHMLIDVPDEVMQPDRFFRVPVSPPDPGPPPPNATAEPVDAVVEIVEGSFAVLAGVPLAYVVAERSLPLVDRLPGWAPRPKRKTPGGVIAEQECDE